MTELSMCTVSRRERVRTVDDRPETQGGQGAQGPKRWLWRGRPPYGYRAEGRELVLDEVEQAALAQMRELHAAGHSTRSIARVLDAEGHPTRSGGRWNSGMVSVLVTRAA
jgi:DNA invertase Pin-like site-specific DNA recombinase